MIVRMTGESGGKWFALAAWFGLSATAHAACNGPAALAARLKAHPTTENAVVMGSWYASHKQFDCAAQTFRDALKTDPKSAELHYLESLALVGGSHPIEAIPPLKQSIELNSKVISPHLTLAYVYDQVGQHTEAEEQWEQALAIDSHSAQALEGLSAELLRKRDFIAVIALLKSVPRTATLNIRLAQAFGTLNYLEEANAVLTQALLSSPNSVPLASAMAVVLVKQVRYQEAINLLKHIMETNPGNQDAELQLFQLLVLTNHISDARPIGTKLLTERPHDSEVLYLNGIVNRALGDYAQSKALLEQAVAIDPNFFNSQYNLGMVLVFLREWKEAREHLEKAIALGATEPQVHFELAKALKGLGESDRAVREMQEYQKLKKDENAKLEAASRSTQAEKDLSEGNVKEAIAHYLQAVQGQPDNASYRYQLALALRQAGDTEGERAQLEEAIKLNPGLAGAQNELGYLLSRTGDAADATEHFRMAVRSAPAWTEAWINLAAELAVEAQFSEAREAIATALRLDPDNTQARELSDQLARDPNVQQARP
jgi:tetratricopeptide (TPR) repeat protein